MSIFFDILEGPRKGAQFEIQPGLKVGRLHGDISLGDQGISEDHAYILEDAKGQLMLFGENETKKFEVNGQAVRKVLLLPGVMIRIGQTTMKVIESHQVKWWTPEPEAEDWKGIIKKYFLQSQFKFRTVTPKISPFKPALRLTFIEGIQADLEWVLGYGPRSVGSSSLDLPIHEKGAPSTCFTISSEKLGSIEFSTENPKQIRLNNRAVSSEKIKNGDFIQIGQTKILVEFIEESNNGRSTENNGGV